jgi:hypothetical protein
MGHLFRREALAKTLTLYNAVAHFETRQALLQPKEGEAC